MKEIFIASNKNAQKIPSTEAEITKGIIVKDNRDKFVGLVTCNTLHVGIVTMRNVQIARFDSFDELIKNNTMYKFYQL